MYSGVVECFDVGRFFELQVECWDKLDSLGCVKLWIYVSWKADPRDLVLHHLYCFHGGAGGGGEVSL